MKNHTTWSFYIVICWANNLEWLSLFENLFSQFHVSGHPLWVTHECGKVECYKVRPTTPPRRPLDRRPWAGQAPPLEPQDRWISKFPSLQYLGVLGVKPQETDFGVNGAHLSCIMSCGHSESLRYKEISCFQISYLLWPKQMPRSAVLSSKRASGFPERRT